jgi:predicted CXXCH cytochrome family protein
MNVFLPFSEYQLPLTAARVSLGLGVLMHLVRSAALTSAIFLAGLVGIACGTSFGQESPERPKTADTSKYVGADVCQGCHEDQYKSFAASAHVHTLKIEKGTQGCESCHGPGAAHVDGGGDPEKIQRFAGASPESIQQRCTSCHAVNLGAAHTKARLTCFTCHSVHHYQQLKSILVTSESQLCQRCHNPGAQPSKTHRR